MLFVNAFRSDLVTCNEHLVGLLNRDLSILIYAPSDEDTLRNNSGVYQRLGIVLGIFMMRLKDTTVPANSSLHYSNGRNKQ